MDLPFTHDQFLDVFGAYNRILWPAAAALWVVTFVVVVRLWRVESRASRMVASLLTLHWGWSGLAYHLAFFRHVNNAAVLFGGLFLVQAGLFAWVGVMRPKLTFSAPSRFWKRIGAGLIFYGLAYPALGLVDRLEYPRMPTFGIPCPTTILTIGLLFMVPKEQVRFLGAIPFLWTVVGGSAAYLLDIHADLALPVAGVALLIYIFSPLGWARRPIQAQTPPSSAGQ
jgi:hypothetical protein